MRPYTAVLLLCAGSSTRMGKDKLFFKPDGQTVLRHAAFAFDASETTDFLVVVCPRTEDAERELYGLATPYVVVGGGDTRQASVACGLRAVPAEARFVSVHDGARPLVTPSEIDAVHTRAYETSAALCGYACADTVKVLDRDGNVLSTPDRSTLFCAATPQAFERSLLEKALEKAQGDQKTYTDDAACVETLGVKIATVPCSRDNFKLTTPEDLDRLCAVLKAREAKR